MRSATKGFGYKSGKKLLYLKGRFAKTSETRSQIVKQVVVLVELLLFLDFN